MLYKVTTTTTTTTEYNIANCLLNDSTFYSCTEVILANVLPAATSDLYGLQQEVNPGLQAASPLP